MAVHAEVAQKIEHLLDLIHIGLLVNGGICRHLIAEKFGHLDCKNAFLEHTFAFNN